MNYQEFKDKVFERACACGLTEYELYYMRSRSSDIGAFEGEVKGFSSSEDAAACFRCVYRGHIGSASTSLFTEDEAERLVAHTMENASCIEKDEPVLFCKGGLVYEKAEPRMVSEVSTAQMAELAKRELKLCRDADRRVTGNSEAGTWTSHSEICLDNSNGVHLTGELHAGAVFAQVVAKDGEDVSSEYGFRCGSVDQIDLEELARETVQKALDSLGASAPDSGVCPAVIAPEAMTSLLAAFSPAFSGENAVNGLSLLKGKEGTKIASDCVTIMDNPFYEESFRQIPFDGEGMPARCKAVIENGTLKTLLYDLASAARAGTESTGNASRMSVSSPISVQPTNFYLRPGTVTAEEICAIAKDGILITGVQGLHAGASFVSGDFSLQSSGFLIRNGRKDRPVKSFTIAGNFFELLKKVTAVGNDMKFNSMRGFGSPSLLVKEIAVSGK